MLISPEILFSEGYLTRSDIDSVIAVCIQKRSFDTTQSVKEYLLAKASGRFASEDQTAFDTFCSDQESWLSDYALFCCLKRINCGSAWYEWEPGLRDRDSRELERYSIKHADDIRHEQFRQFVFYTQWERLKTACNHEGISIIGDIPLYVAGDSCDVWCNRSFFDLAPDGRPSNVSGVPPDYFSPTGQRWGAPVYRWPDMADEGYGWWTSRLRHLSHLFDEIRIDHFRGIESYYTIPASEETAVNGKWVPGPGADLLRAISGLHLPSRLIAEDLGIITAPVTALMEMFGLPGMRVLQFAFGDDLPESPHVPHNHQEQVYVYTGTHDNNTARGWYEDEADAPTRKRLSAYTGGKVTLENVHREFIRLAMSSVAQTAIIPFQDLAGLPGTARMNTPGTTSGNWTFRIEKYQFPDELVRWLGEITCLYGRARRTRRGAATAPAGHAL
jgi:4-alpha-glucanotransferase